MGFDMYRLGDNDGPDYWRRNVFGMTRVLIALEAVGAVVRGYDAPRELLDEGRKDEWLRWAPEVPAISMHKFESNDGWVVSRVECQLALRAIRSWPGPLPEALTAEYGDDDLSCIAWFETCAEADGFDVL